MLWPLLACRTSKTRAEATTLPQRLEPVKKRGVDILCLDAANESREVSAEAEQHDGQTLYAVEGLEPSKIYEVRRIELRQSIEPLENQFLVQGAMFSYGHQQMRLGFDNNPFHSSGVPKPPWLLHGSGGGGEFEYHLKVQSHRKSTGEYDIPLSFHPKFTVAPVVPKVPGLFSKLNVLDLGSPSVSLFSFLGDNTLPPHVVFFPPTETPPAKQRLLVQIGLHLHSEISVHKTTAIFHTFALEESASDDASLVVSM